ncbi:MAG: hybrid sensor histidine kinase/response regulator, partial [Nitrosomonas sp.]|nr:hybrid sensor histidine kinase/response regulator [Nitrosomonas sp.]
MIVILIIVVFQSRELQRSVSELEGRRSNAILLTQELFQSSEDLTRMARAYVVTGDSIYKYYFFRILAIRNGLSPRPIDYAPTYWNLKQADKEHHIQLGEAVAL